MRRPVVLVLLALVALVVGTQLGWRFVLAPLLGLAIWAWASATLRSMALDGGTGVAASDEPVAVAPSEGRTFYWCEECGTEVVLLVRGSGAPPRHCATRMHERAEVTPRRRPVE